MGNWHDVLLIYLNQNRFCAHNLSLDLIRNSRTQGSEWCFQTNVKTSRRVPTGLACGWKGRWPQLGQISPFRKFQTGSRGAAPTFGAEQPGGLLVGETRIGGTPFKV